MTKILIICTNAIIVCKKIFLQIINWLNKFEIEVNYDILKDLGLMFVTNFN